MFPPHEQPLRRDVGDIENRAEPVVSETFQIDVCNIKHGQRVNVDNGTYCQN